MHTCTGALCWVKVVDVDTQVLNIYSVSGQVWILTEDRFKSGSVPEYIISGIMCHALQRVS